MPQIGEFRTVPRPNGKGTHKHIWVACAECGKERWVLNYQWDRGQCKICHHCYVINHSVIMRPEYHYQIRGAGNTNWKGGVRLDQDGYILVYIDKDDPFYPMTGNRGSYVLEHRLVMAKALGRCLTSEELVHHIDGNRVNNKLLNLEITNHESHQLGYRIGYKKGFQDGIKCAMFTINPNTGFLDVGRSL